MTRAMAVPQVQGFLGVPATALRHGLQLAGCVLLGYGLAVVLGLPERFWVVITVLIVMRADSDSVVGAGWDRVLGTVVGALSGLLGVYVQHVGANAVVVTLTIVSALAFASAAWPLLRSSAIAALIVLGAGQLAGHSAFAVAWLRVAQIAIGVGVCVVVAWVTSQYSTRARLMNGCATLLGRMGLQLQMRTVRPLPTEEQMEASGVAVRTALQGLASLAGNADRTYPWTRVKTSHVHARHHRRIAALVGRVVQDVAVLHRVLGLLRNANTNAAQAARAATDAASVALTSAARALAGNGEPSFGAMQELVQVCDAGDGWGGSSAAAMLAAPLRLLLDDLQQLCAHRA